MFKKGKQATPVQPVETKTEEVIVERELTSSAVKMHLTFKNGVLQEATIEKIAGNNSYLSSYDRSIRLSPDRLEQLPALLDWTNVACAEELLSYGKRQGALDL